MREQAREIVQQLQRAGHTAFFAGGCVRDQLLGREAKDYDIATSANPEEVQALFRRVSDLTGKSFGVIRVMVGEHAFEVATFRQDGVYRDGRRPESVRFATPEEDAQRRDFTVNGLFFNPVAGKLIDYVGGEADLHARVMRAIRFATRLDFTIEPATWEAIRAGAPGIRGISAERIRDELNLIFTARRPERGLDLLDQSGLLQFVLPDIAALHGVEQPPQFHPEGDVFEHERLMLSHMQQPDLELALAIPRRGQEADRAGRSRRAHPVQRPRNRRRGDGRANHDRAAV
jgi:poly(A) polymerase